MAMFSFFLIGFLYLSVFSQNEKEEIRKRADVSCFVFFPLTAVVMVVVVVVVSSCCSFGLFGLRFIVFYFCHLLYVVIVEFRLCTREKQAVL